MANDQPLVNFFCQESSKTALHHQRRYLLFLLKTIAYVNDWLYSRSKSAAVTANVAAEWKEYIGLPRSPRRVEIYTSAIDPSPLRGFEDIMDENVEFSRLKNRGPFVVYYR